MSRAFVGLGSNMGDREKSIRAALDQLGRIPGTTLRRVSSLYNSEAEGDASQPGYLNAVAQFETDRPPRQFLWHLFLIEARLGRQRRRRWGPRPIDLDLLAYEQRIMDEPDLILPHPRMLERPFVLVPMEEIDPDFVHPVAGRPIRQILRERRFSGGVRWLGRIWQ
ncbi:MAG: 2-amino-4-hydroxy-6-hydroxymethyldihydropteridine diphosphokinase [bacterium]|nr:MAG: 2-amino-4-hydroxy-6-hydroxymethyldihydropteridine diphosphokinase [bacterium]